MEIFRRYFVVIILLVIIVIIWGGVVLFSDRRYSTINANAENYIKPLNSQFDEETLKTISERTTNSFPILPVVFFELNND